jgi:prophage tail gpP-like protein
LKATRTDSLVSVEDELLGIDEAQFLISEVTYSLDSTAGELTKLLLVAKETYSFVPKAVTTIKTKASWRDTARRTAAT